MPREIVTHTTVYTLDELDPQVREKAVENVRNLLGGAWWDQSDDDDLARVIVYTLAEKFGTAGWDTSGVGDFPGIPGIKLDGWDMQRGQYIVLNGRLTRDNAPALPWVTGLGAVDLEAQRDHTYLSVENEDPECICPSALWAQGHQDCCPGAADNPATEDERAALIQAVREAMADAWKAAYAEMEYKTSTEYAEEDIDANDREFLADGTLYH